VQVIPRTTEIRPGTYVFYDASSLAAKLCDEADCALRVLTTVVSTAVPGQCVIRRVKNVLERSDGRCRNVRPLHRAGAPLDHAQTE